MALVVESGAGLSTAESFISVVDADARHLAFGNSAWAALTTGVKEESLRKAAAYMEQAYRSRWKGLRLTLTQALSWPRSDVLVDGFGVASDIVPAEVSRACADLALTASTAALAPNLTRGVIREKVGPIETEYDRGSPQPTRYRAVDLALAPYLKGGVLNVGLVRG